MLISAHYPPSFFSSLSFRVSPWLVLLWIPYRLSAPLSISHSQSSSFFPPAQQLGFPSARPSYRQTPSLPLSSLWCSSSPPVLSAGKREIERACEEKRREMFTLQKVNQNVNVTSIVAVSDMKHAHLKLEKQICRGREANKITVYVNKMTVHCHHIYCISLLRKCITLAAFRTWAKHNVNSPY